MSILFSIAVNMNLNFVSIDDNIVVNIVSIVIFTILHEFQYIVTLFHIVSIVSYWRIVPAPKWLLLPRLLLQQLKFSFHEPVSPTALFNATLWNHIKRYTMKSCRNIHLIATTTATTTISLCIASFRIIQHSSPTCSWKLVAMRWSGTLLCSREFAIPNI